MTSKRSRIIASLRSAVLLLVGLSTFWAILLTTVMLHDDPARFHCGDESCSAGEVGALLGRNGFVALWLLTPYIAIGWALQLLARPLNRAMPRRLRHHPRWAAPMRWVIIVLPGLGHVWIVYATYLMLKHNPQGEFCTQVNSLAEADFYPPCSITLGEITSLFARNMFLLAVVLAPLIVAGWLLTVLGVSLQHGRCRRWLGRRPFD